MRRSPRRVSRSPATSVVCISSITLRKHANCRPGTVCSHTRPRMVWIRIHATADRGRSAHIPDQGWSGYGSIPPQTRARQRFNNSPRSRRSEIPGARTACPHTPMLAGPEGPERRRRAGGSRRARDIAFIERIRRRIVDESLAPAWPTCGLPGSARSARGKPRPSHSLRDCEKAGRAPSSVNRSPSILPSSVRSADARSRSTSSG
jgi:hypothetical protein